MIIEHPTRQTADYRKQVALIPGIGLGDSLLFVPTIWSLLQEGYRIKMFSSALRQLSHRMPSVDFAQTCQFTSNKHEILAELADCHFIFVQKNSPAEDYVTSPLAVKIVGCTSWSGNTQASQIEQTIGQTLNLALAPIEKVREWLGFKTASTQNGFSWIAIHPTSSHHSKNWPIEKFIKVAKILKSQGFKVAFCLDQREETLARELEKDFFVWLGLTLEELCVNLSQCKLFIGTDSGIGHLASLLGVPTVSIFQSKRHSLLWRPSWSSCRIAYPCIPLPNILKKRLWKQMVGVYQVLQLAKQILR